MGNGKRNPGRAGALIAGLVMALAPPSGMAMAKRPQPSAATVDVFAETETPLTALAVTAGWVRCAERGLVGAKNGKTGFLAPMIGQPVTRGSSASASAVTSPQGTGLAARNAVPPCLAAR